MNEMDKFVDGLPEEDKPFDINAEMQGSQPEDTNVEGAPSSQGANTENEEENLPFNKNPKMKRFIERQVEKRLREMTPAQQQSQQSQVAVPTDVPAEWIAMYGDNEDTRKAWGFQQKLLNDYGAKIKQETLESIKGEKTRLESEAKANEDFIDDSIENIEEKFGVTLTTKDRNEFLDLVQRLSPKDANGNIKEYADFHTAYEMFADKKNIPDKTVARQKTLASRSSSTHSTEAPTAPKGYQQGMGFDGVRQALGID